MTTNPQQLELAPAIRSKLTALRRRIRRYVWLEGLAASVAWLGIAFWASLAVDWFFEPPRAVRVLVLGIAGLGLVWVLFRRIFRRAFVRLSNRNMAMLLERHFSQFDESLLTAVELTDPGRGTAQQADHPSSFILHPSSFTAMLAHTCRQAAVPIGDVRLRKVFNPVPLRRIAVAAALLAAAVWAFGTLEPEAFGTWTQRSLLLDDQFWPRKTRLIVEGFEDGATKVARGADLEVIAKADLKKPLVPKVVEVRYRAEGGPRLWATMSREGEVDRSKDKFQEYSHTFRGVLTPIRFDVVGGDAAVRDLRIEVVDSPTIVEMVLDCRFPDYMDHPPRTLPVTGVMQLPVGTRIEVRASANKDLVKVEIDDDEGGTREQQAAGSREQAAGSGQRAADKSSIINHHLSFVYMLPDFTEDKTLLFTLFDTDGIKSREPMQLALRAIADESPQLSCELRGIGPAITPQARLPAVGRITDDYGIARIWFEYTIAAGSGQQAAGSGQQAADRSSIINHQSSFIIHGNATEVALDEALEVGDLELTPGQKLTVCVKAADRYDLADQPNVGTSRQWLLDVVTPEQLRTMLEARELVLRQRFERVVQEVTETRDSLLRVDFDGRDVEVERASQNSRKNAHETLGLAEAFLDIREELVNNRIDTAELKLRLQGGIADPLRRVAEEMFPELDRLLDRLEATLADDQAGPENRRLAVAQVDAILLAMQSVLERMLELEDFNKAVELLREIIHSQERLSEQTRNRHKEKLRELLEE